MIASSSTTNCGTQSGNHPNLNLPFLSMTTSPCVIPPSNLGGSIDTQNQVMLMLAESFTKLSTVMVQEKSSDVKYEWPKFSGDTNCSRLGTLLF